MISIFLTERLPNVGDSILLTLLTSNKELEGGLFQQIPTAPFKKMVTFVGAPEKANYFMVPHNYSHIEGKSEYISGIEKLAEKHGKKIVLFNYGDRNSPIFVKHSIILRTSGYKSKLLENEILVPAFVEDLGEQFGVLEKKKKNEKPVVSFAGWVRYDTVVPEVKYQVKVFLAWLMMVFGDASPASFQGIYYRRRAVDVLQKSERVNSKFHLRTSYSGNKNTVVGNKDTVRKEFVSAIQDADLALAIRGDGNWSLRFYEVLSLGRIPLYVDTDAPLPLEEEIDYDEFTISLDYKEIKNIANIAADKWNSLSLEELQKKQKKAREVFETKLRVDSFYKHLFEKLEKQA